jgi:hypothetical protein
MMPQGGDPSHPRAAATAYQCVVRQGLVWVKLQPASKDGSGVHVLVRKVGCVWCWRRMLLRVLGWSGRAFTHC